MSVKNISSAILGVGVDDTTIDLFESQYPVPTGVSYNSYVIRDEKTAILDTVDARATDEWMANVTEALAGEKPAYLVVHHMEPDHGANVARLAALYPEMQVVGNAKTFQYMEQFFGPEAIAKERRVVVKDGESLSLGAHTLTFVFAPMVHWPEVMVSYESTEKVLFSADGFGRFGAVAKFDEKADWASEARRYLRRLPLPADGEPAGPPQDQGFPEPHHRPDGERHLGAHGRKAHARRAGRHEEHHRLRHRRHPPLCFQRRR